MLGELEFISLEEYRRQRSTWEENYFLPREFPVAELKNNTQAHTCVDAIPSQFEKPRFDWLCWPK